MAGRRRLHVSSGAVIIAASAAQASRYRVFGLDLRAILRAAVYTIAIEKPCQRKWMRVQPRRSTHGWDESIWISVIRSFLSRSESGPASCEFRPTPDERRAVPRAPPAPGFWRNRRRLVSVGRRRFVAGFVLWARGPRRRATRNAHYG